MDKTGHKGHSIKNLVVVPARFSSTRLVGKPLILINGKPLIQHVVENIGRAAKAERIVVATDDERILKTVTSFGGDAVMTSDRHPTGSDRVAEVASMFNAEYIVNVQGDEPRIPPSLIDGIFNHLEAGVPVVTASRPLRNAQELSEPSRVKVVSNKEDFALLFSRAPIPFAREESEQEAAVALARIHMGIYGFNREIILGFPNMNKPEIEAIERLEQLRLLYAGIPIKVIPGEDFGDSIDTRKDLESFIRLINGEQ